MKPEVKKLIIANLPYLLFVYLFGKLGQAYRLAEGIDLSQKLLHFADGCAASPVLRRCGSWCTARARTPRNTAKAWSTAAPDGAAPRI